MWIYRNNIVAIHAALVVSAFAWLWGGLRGPELVAVMPWLVALLAEVMICFPERRGLDESTYQARERVWRAMRKDPLVWVEVAFLLMLAVPFGNNGLCPSCDVALIAQGLNPKPPFGFLPFCVSRPHHLSVFMWFLPTLTAVTAIRHSLTKAGKRKFCEMIVWNAMFLAILGFVQQVMEAPGPLWWNPYGGTARRAYFFSTFGYPNAGGAFFTSAFALSVAVWRRHDEDIRIEYVDNKKNRTMSGHQYFWQRHYMAIPTTIIFFAAINTLSRAAIILVSASAFILMLHAAICTLTRLKRATRVKAGAAMAFVAILIAILISVFTPESVRKEMSTLKTSNEALDRLTNKGEYHSKLAIDLFWKHPLFGCGGWGYAHLGPGLMPKEIRPRRSFNEGSANVHNDYLQFLAEHGIVGFACLVAIAALLLIPPCKMWKTLYLATRFADKKKQPPKPHAIFALPAGAFAILIGVLAILIHGFGDCPMRSPAVLSLLYCELAALDGFLPRVKTAEESK